MNEEAKEQQYGLLLTELRRLSAEKGADTVCKLGASSGYLYIGSIGDLIANMNKYQRVLKAWHKKQIAKAEDNLESLKKKRIISPQSFINSLDDKNGYEDLTWQNYQKYVESYFERVRRAYREIGKREKRLIELVSLCNRQVLEISDSIYEANTIRIVIDGSEHGNYWATDEATEMPAFSLEVEEETKKKEGETKP